MGELFAFPEIESKDETPRTKPLDQSERDRALDVTRSWIVEAPAGSGKTGLLIQRYLKLLALPGIDQPEQVLAITFTLKATGEIRDRVLEQFERAARPDVSTTEFDRQTYELAKAVLERDRAMGWNLVEHPRRLNIRTIDSICAEIARGLPVLAGGGNLTPVEDASSLHQLAAERTLMQLGGEDQPLSNALSLLLLHRDGNLTQLRDLLGEMLAFRDQWGRLVPLGKLLEDSYLNGTVLPRIEKALAEAICVELAVLSRALPQHFLSELATLAGELGYNEGYKGQRSPITICAGKYGPPEASVEALDHWRALCHLLIKKDGWRSGFNSNYIGFVIDKHQKERLNDLLDTVRDREELLAALQRVAALPPKHYPPEQWSVVKALFRILYRALAELQIVFAEHGECDFTELGLIARYALREANGAFESTLGADLQHILVDEMQDTSSSQYELIEMLTRGWDGRSQTIFLVGDPKQSIYLFRQARVERFIQTMQQEQLGELGLSSIRLTANFRSQSGLVRSFNEDFSLLFPPQFNDDHPEEPPYVRADPVRGPSHSGARNIVWHAQVLPSGLSPDEKLSVRRKQAKLEALQIRKTIEEWRARPLPEHGKPWKIAVLVRNRRHLTDIVAELKGNDRAEAIPFRALNIEPLGERPEILDLFALTRALLHPADRAAWLSVLRAPWCGLELADLHLLTGSDDPLLAERTIENLLFERGQELNEQSIRRLQKTWNVLQTASAQNSRLPVAEWVERTWRSLGGDTYLVAEERTNAGKYFELLNTLEEKAGAVDFTQLQNRLEELYAEPAMSPGAVDLVTIHGAKGLEWDVVLVPGLEKSSRVSRGRLLTWNETTSSDEDSARVLLAPILGKGRDSEALNDWLNRIQKERELAEARRLFYVACTRAREELHLFAAPAETVRGEIGRTAGSLLQAAWSVAERHFVNIQAPAKPLIAPVLTVRPAPQNSFVIPEVAAAVGEAMKPPAILRRFPLDLQTSNQFRPRLKPNPEEAIPGLPLARFERPEGSFEARAFGNTVHAFIEAISGRLATGIQANTLAEEIETWGPRIAAILRSYGLSPQTVTENSIRVKTALKNVVTDPSGLWTLLAHKDAASERAFSSWDEARSIVRLDRVFRAGSEPFVPGDDFLWIVDYKTTEHTGAGIEDFILRERKKYTPQMETYARIIRDTASGIGIKVALYYPLLPKLIWWTPALD